MRKLKHVVKRRVVWMTRYALLVMGLLAGFEASATELVYAPINPSFVGGNPNNAAGLLAIAGAQNDTHAPTLTPLQNFNNALQQAILNRLSSDSLTTIFGKGNTLVPGTYDTGSYSISIQNMGNGTLQITTTDKSSGAQVSFNIASSDLAVTTGP